jgi:hypothetical protein
MLRSIFLRDLNAKLFSGIGRGLALAWWKR